jgi:nucleoside-diphosphate-sugar epimerase
LQQSGSLAGRARAASRIVVRQSVPVGQKRLPAKPLPVDDPKQRHPDITRARTLLGWEPKVQLEEGLLKTVGFFKQKLGIK